MAPSPVVLKPTPVVINITPFGFHRYASEFLHAAQLVGIGQSFSPVPYYLYCRSLELILKAFLLTQNVSLQELKGRRFGHNLVKVLDKAKELRLEKIITVSSAHENELVKANKYYKSKGFEYFKAIDAVSGYSDLPDISALKEFASLLIDALEQLCLHVK